MSTAKTPKAKMIVLVSSDGLEFEVERANAVESDTIMLMINDDRADDIVPVPLDVHSKILAPVIQYCKTHAEAAAVHGAAAAKEHTNAFDTEFLKVDLSTLFDLILAANYLNIKSLLDLTCQTVADMMNRMTPEEMRRFVSG